MLAVALALLLSAMAFAQTGTGGVSGTITNRSGGSAAGAMVRLVNQGSEFTVTYFRSGCWSQALGVELGQESLQIGAREGPFEGTRR